MPRTRYHINQPPLAKEGDLSKQLEELQKSHDALLRSLNVTLQRISVRFDDNESVGTKKPPAPNPVSAEGRQGAFHVRWQKVKGVTGYIVQMGTSSDGTLITDRIPIHDAEAQTCRIPWGNVASTRYFIVYATNNGNLSDPSNIASATSVSFGAGESAPTSPSAYSDDAVVTPPSFDSRVRTEFEETRFGEGTV